MTPEPAPGPADDAQALRAALRAGLVTALKARDTDAVTALRTAIAAIDNAQAAPAPAAASAHIAGARSGAGYTEAARRQLGSGSIAHLEENVGAARLRLTPDDIASLAG